MKYKAYGKYKYTRIVLELAVLSELGFKEQNDNTWRLDLPINPSRSEHINKYIIAKEDKLIYVQKEIANTYNEVTLWEYKSSGIIDSSRLKKLIETLKLGHGADRPWP